MASNYIVRAALFVLLAWAGGVAHGHKASDSYLSLRVQGNDIAGRWDIALRDLDVAIGLDANQDGRITWGEVRSRHSQISAYALSRLTLTDDGATCAAFVSDHAIDRHSDGAYAVLRLTARCEHPPASLTVAYRLLFDLDAQHRGLVQLQAGDRTRSGVLAPDAARQTFSLYEPGVYEQLRDYFVHGVWHIWIGFDHVLFLLSLLLPAVLSRKGGRWQAADGLAASLVDVLKVVTAFTLAHSITLSLAALNWVHVPSRVVESAIAASVIFAAANNVFPVITTRRWLLAFLFGLVHGFGFASVLADLGLPADSLLAALIAFNTGVEAGQLAVVTLFIPIAWIMRRSWLYRGFALYASSAAVALLATLWLVERAFDIRVLS